MSEYIDGFVLPIARSRLDEYKQLVTAIAEIWMQHGALEYREFIGDDMTLAGTRSFIDTTSADKNDAIVFGWVAFKSRDERDRANKQVAADPRVAELMSASNSGCDATRMIYGGFQSFVRV